MSSELANRLKNEEEYGYTLTLKVKMHAFETKTKGHALKVAIISEDQIYSQAEKLLNAFEHCKISLLGIKISNFNHENNQKRITEYFTPSKISSE